MATLSETQSLIEDVNNIKRWHHDRNLIDGSDDKSQFAKLIQEAGELSDNICKNKDIADDIGDMIVVLINIAERNDLSLTQCVRKAWDDIKDRKGQMRDGVFIKEEDLIKESLGIK
jgi:NTP pyrophosphatase (non-canonical NTP hydrolase)